MMNNLRHLITICLLLFVGSISSTSFCYADDGVVSRATSRVGDNMIPLHVEGRYFKDASGNIVNLHGFGQTYSPWFNERGSKWSNYNVQACLQYNQDLILKMIAAGWKGNWLRLHMDPYWSNKPGVSTSGESDIHAFDFERFKTYLDEVFVPMAQFAMRHGMYVVMRPPGVFPETVQAGDAYQQYLIKVWSYVSQHSQLKNNPGILYELGNEPIKILKADGSAGGDKDMAEYIQPVVDAVRANANNIVLVPGLGWQSQYAGFAAFPIKGVNVGFAVHCYPGWYNGGHDMNNEVVVDYESFRKGWDEQVGPCSSIAPIFVTEMDWAPVKYQASWGKSTTSTFGNAFKKIADNEGNVSWMIFTGPEILAKYTGKAYTSDADKTVLNDPEACVWPAYHWFADYAKVDYPASAPYGKTLTRGKVTKIELSSSSLKMKMGDLNYFKVIATYADGSTDNVTADCEYTSSTGACRVTKGCVAATGQGASVVTVTYYNRDGSKIVSNFTVNVDEVFPLTNAGFDPNIWETGSFDENTGNLITGAYGFGGWKYPSGVDLSDYKYVVVELNRPQSNGASFRLFDENSYWSQPLATDLGNNTHVAIALQNRTKTVDGKLVAFNPEHIYIAGIWTYGGGVVSIKRVFLSNDGVNEATGIDNVEFNSFVDGNQPSFNLSGQRVGRDYKGIVIRNGKKMIQR